MIALDGLLAFPLTPFTEDASAVNLDALADNVERHIDAGAGAIFVACGTGEFSSLSPEEHANVLARAREAARGRVPVWVGAGGGVSAARAGIAAAQAGRADGVLLLPPYLVTGPPTGLLDYVRFAIADSSVPTVVYHRSPGIFTAAAAKSLVDIPAVVGLKDGYGDIDLMTRIVTAVRATGRGADFLFFNGLPTAEMSAKAYRAIGVARYSSAVHCFVPEIAHRFHRALAEGDEAAMDALLAGFYLPLVNLRDEGAGYAVSLIKAGARLRGDKVGPVRPPLAEPPGEHLERLQDIVTRGFEVLKTLESD